MASQTVLAIDLGAESGRVMAVHFDGAHLKLEELHRFPNPVTAVRGTLYWDTLHLWRNIQQGIERGKAHRPASIGVDAWAMDFGLLDAPGEPAREPGHYRDAARTACRRPSSPACPGGKIFEQTGIQFMPINTLYQL